jgi:hypothetical protein
MLVSEAADKREKSEIFPMGACILFLDVLYWFSGGYAVLHELACPPPSQNKKPLRFLTRAIQ